MITISDSVSNGTSKDESGPILVKALEDMGLIKRNYYIIPDEVTTIAELLEDISDEGADLIVTTGGTGFSMRDVTPEATKKIIDREAPGISEAIRSFGMTKTPNSMLSRGVCGLKEKTLIINMPGSPKAVKDSLEVISPVLNHAFDMIQGKKH